MEGNTDRTLSLDRSDSTSIATSRSVIESRSPPIASLAIAVGHQSTPQIVESSRRQPMQEVMAWSAPYSGGHSPFDISSMGAALGDHRNPSSYSSQQQQHHQHQQQQQQQRQQNLHRQQQQQQQLSLQQQQQLSVTAAAGSQRFAYHPQHHGQAFDPRFAGNQPGSPDWNASYGQQYPLPYQQRPHAATGSSSRARGFALNHPQMSPGQLNIAHNVMDYRDLSPWVAQPQHQAQHLGPYLYSTAPYLPSAERFPGGPVAGYSTSFSARENISPGAGQYTQPDYLAAGSERSRQAATAAGYRLPDYSPGPGLHASSPSGIAVDSRLGSGEPSTSPFPLMPRGPPRKPRQSGHALWVGNLPPGTHITDLKDHFSRDATKDIESVFLISKSNCAFVNYKTEATCASAMTRFHDSRFQGVRLVCRLRRNSASPSPGVPRGPAADYNNGSAFMTAARRKIISGALPDEDDAAAAAVDDGESVKPLDRGGLPETRDTKDQYFVVKSLTLEDLEMSVKNGIWATQAHNEAGLNKAYDSADVVYLIFSANKSGEYFGYARMASRIESDSSSNIEWAPKSVKAEASDLPKAILTPATATAPRGKIIDDSARGTIFWESEALEDPDVASKAGQDASSGEEEEREGSSPDTAWGRPSKIEWISTTRLPFYRTRGLRNPWNANREVKIARDGTELETSVGRRLLTMLNRPGHASSTGSYGQLSSAGQPSQDGSQQMPNMGPY